MAKTTETVNEFIINTLTAEQYSAALKSGEIDPNQLYLTPEKKLVIAVSQAQYEEMKAAGTLDEDVIYVTPVDEQTVIENATQSKDGLMSAKDKTKLDGIAVGANNYSLPTASSSTLGGVRTTSSVSNTNGLTASPIINGVVYYKETTVDSSFSSTSTNPVQNKVVYNNNLWLYCGTAYVNSWNTTTGEYYQNVTVSAVDGGPTLSYNVNLSPPMTAQTSSSSTNETLQEALNVINNGYCSPYSGGISITVFERPTCDINLYWYAR